MDNETKLKCRAFAGFYRALKSSPERTPAWESSHVERDPATDHEYLALRDVHGRFVAVYRIGNQNQLKKLVRVPSFLRPTAQTDF
jgi:hypothetical protein